MIRKEKLIPILEMRDEIRRNNRGIQFPDEHIISEAVEYLGISPADLFFNPHGDSTPFLYYKDIVVIDLPDSLAVEELELVKMKNKIKQTHKSLQAFINRNEWKRLFLFMDHRILSPSIDDLFEHIPEEQRTEVLTAVQNRLGYYPVLRNEAAVKWFAGNLL